ncbi:MAG: PD-(D/E)XK nuclease family protein, partial [Prevotellaceae bacterium]|nr:PD-(D/E)XK nuclease family protein [Prevotellaceae bacterium]
MSYFLQHVAQDLRAHFADLSRVVVVFPNRRAGLFLNDYLVEDAPDDTPLWAPRYVTISELFRELSDVTLNDAVDSVCRLYAHYVDLLRSAGDAAADELSLDTFYGWADRILADFDDVDKNMADASQLFRNLEELKELESTEFLSKAQKELIGSFFSNFDPDHKSELRERFRRLWNALLPLYRRLNAELLAEGKAYEGALYRRVVNALAEERCALPADVDCYA